MCEGRRDRSALPALFARRSCAEPLLFLNAELRAARYRIAREAPEPCSRPPAPPVFSCPGSLWTRCSPLLFPSSPLCFIISARAWVCQAVEREMWGMSLWSTDIALSALARIASQSEYNTSFHPPLLLRSLARIASKVHCIWALGVWLLLRSLARIASAKAYNAFQQNEAMWRCDSKARNYTSYP